MPAESASSLPSRHLPERLEGWRKAKWTKTPQKKKWEEDGWIPVWSRNDPCVMQSSKIINTGVYRRSRDRCSQRFTSTSTTTGSGTTSSTVCREVNDLQTYRCGQQTNNNIAFWCLLILQEVAYVILIKARRGKKWTRWAVLDMTSLGIHICSSWQFIEIATPFCQYKTTGAKWIPSSVTALPLVNTI